MNPSFLSQGEFPLGSINLRTYTNLNRRQKQHKFVRSHQFIPSIHTKTQHPLTICSWHSCGGTVLHFSKNTVQVPRLVHRILKHRDKLQRDQLNGAVWVPAIAFCQNVARLYGISYTYIILHAAAPLQKRMP